MTKRLLDAGADPNDDESLYHALEDVARTRLLLEAGARVTGSNARYRVLHERVPRGGEDGLPMIRPVRLLSGREADGVLVQRRSRSVVAQRQCRSDAPGAQRRQASGGDTGAGDQHQCDHPGRWGKDVKTEQKALRVLAQDQRTSNATSSADEIAQRLGVSRRTVERAMRHVLDVCQRRLRR